MRDQFSLQVAALKEESLKRSNTIMTVEDGTEAFNRQFTLEIVESEQRTLTALNDALRRLDAGEYGVCINCGCNISVLRLQALPFVRMCIKCKTKLEMAPPRRVLV